MNLSNCRIGTEFTPDGIRRYRCTDVGSRVVVAIRVDDVEVYTLHMSVETSNVLRGTEAQAKGFFNGPQYAVVETVFDEYDFDGIEFV